MTSTPLILEDACEYLNTASRELSPAVSGAVRGEAEQPIRIQLSRAKGFNLQAASLALNGLPCVKVDRTTRFGNPWMPGDPGTVRIVKLRGGWDVVRLPMALTVAGCVDRHRRWMRGEFTTPDGAIRMNHPLYDAVICDVPPDVSELLGKNLGCWCALPKPGEPDICHAAVLLDIANAPEGA